MSEPSTITFRPQICYDIAGLSLSDLISPGELFLTTDGQTELSRDVGSDNNITKKLSLCVIVVDL